MKNLRLSAAMCAALIAVAWVASAQTPRAAAPASGRWEYAEMYMLHGSTGLRWTIVFPGSKIISGEKVADVAKQLNIPALQEGTLGMYNVMGSLGYELVMPGNGIQGVSSENAIFRRPI